MFAKKHRLARTMDVRLTLARGRAFFYPLMAIRFKQGVNPLTTPRFTVVVSTKVSKKSVERNRLKRIIREAIKGFISKVIVGDYVIIVRPQANLKTSFEIRQAVIQSFVMAGLLKL